MFATNKTVLDWLKGRLIGLRDSTLFTLIGVMAHNTSTDNAGWHQQSQSKKKAKKSSSAAKQEDQ